MQKKKKVKTYVNDTENSRRGDMGAEQIFNCVLIFGFFLAVYSFYEDKKEEKEDESE